MRFLAIIGFILIFIQLSINAKVYKILNEHYTCVHNETLNTTPPQYVEYTKDGLFAIIADKRKLKIEEHGRMTIAGRMRVMPRQLMMYTDNWRSLIQINKGEIDFTYRDTKNYEVKTKADYKVFQMTPDVKQSSVYFLAKPLKATEKIGSVFAMNTANLNIHNEIIQCEEVEFLGNHVAFMAANPEGNIAVFTKSDDKFRFVLLKPTSEPIEDLKTGVEIITSTENPKTQVITTTQINEKCKTEFRETIEQGIQKIRETYEKDMKYCRSMTNKAQILFQKYSRTLELTNTEEDLVRKQNLPSLKLEQPYEVAIGNIINDIGKQLLQVFEETTSGTCGKNKFELDRRTKGDKTD